MLRFSLDRVLSDLQAGMAFCRTLGLRPERSRFGDYSRRIGNIIDAIRPGPDGQVQHERLGPLLDLQGVVALAESAELGQITPFLKTVDPVIVRAKLHRVFQGPGLPYEENAISNESRNVLFELNVAEHLWRAGLKPELGEHPDLVCQVAGVPVLMECKRPLVGPNVPKAIREAAGQLAPELRRASAGSKGMVVISVTKALNPGDRVLQLRDAEDGRVILISALRKIADHQKRHVKKLGRKIIGVWYHVFTPATDGTHVGAARQGALEFRSHLPGVVPIREALTSALKNIAH